LIAFLAGRIRSTNQLLSRNSAWIRELRRQVYSDKLTGLYNTSYLKDTLKTFPPADQPTSAILMMKPDRFKDINDTYGHEVGDRTIRLLARTFQEQVEPIGSAVRYRGNELAAVLPGVDRAGCHSLAAALREAVAEIDISDMTGGEPVEISTSMGIAVAPEDATEAASAGSPGERLLQCAYERLMRARNDGGGRSYDEDRDN
jgi:diguanylate cyclase (GGDEF)-like protein